MSILLKMLMMDKGGRGTMLAIDHNSALVVTLPDIHLYIATLLHCYIALISTRATLLLHHWMGKSTTVELACKCWSDRSFWLTELSQPLYEVESPFRFQVGGSECVEHKKAQKQQHFK